MVGEEGGGSEGFVSPAKRSRTAWVTETVKGCE